MDDILQELESLLFDWESGILDDEGVERVREILRSHPEAQDAYVQWQVFHAALKLQSTAGIDPLSIEGTGSEDVLSDVAKPTVRTIKLNFSPKFWGIAACLLVCVLIGRVVSLEFASSRETSIAAAIESTDLQNLEVEEVMSHGVAILTRLVDVNWDTDQTPLEVGDALPPGTLSLESGFAQIEFFCGATLVIEGPAELVLKSSESAQVLSGRLRAQVPPAARGFSLEVEDMEVVDLGTEFGLAVSSAGIDVQVFDGEVELHRPESEKKLLTTGQGLSRSGKEEFRHSVSTPEMFVDISTLETRDQGQDLERYRNWKNWSAALQKDPRLIAYYAFGNEDLSERTVRNLSLRLDSELDGAVVGAREVSGRWNTKSALEFKRPGDRVRVQFPGEYSSLTLACWVKIDSLDRLFNSLFLTDNYNQGEPHWQILHTGQMYFSVRPSKPGTAGPPDQKVLSPSFWKPSMSGKWLHLATTYDAESGLVKHFLNGNSIHSEVIPSAQIVKKTRIGIASIGNWDSPTLPDAEFAIRNLNGSIDEFALFAAALDPEEIKEMFLNGKP